MDVRRLLKVYNFVNDEKKARINLKFAAFTVAALAGMGALISYALYNGDGDEGSCPPVCSTPTSREAYVGLAPAEIRGGGDLAALAQERLDAWKADHPDWEIESTEEVQQGGVTVGYNVRYHERQG